MQTDQSEQASSTPPHQSPTSQPHKQKRPGRGAAVLRAIVLVALVLAWLGIGSVGGQSIGKLSTVTTNDQSVFLPRDAESVRAEQALQQFEDTGVLPAFVVVSGARVEAEALPPGPPKGPPGAAYAQRIVDGVSVEVDGTTRPLSEFVSADQPPVVIASQDGTGVMVLLPLDAAKAQAKKENGHSMLSEVVESIRDQAPAALTSPGSAAPEVNLAGPAGFVADLGKAFGGIDSMLLLVTFAVVLVILLIVYRSLALPLLVLLSAVMAMSAAGFVVFKLAESGTITVNGQAQGILFILVVGAATDYALLLVARYREELLRHDSTWPAMKKALRACIEPILASAGTVTAGLLCLLLADLNSSRFLGPVGAIGIVAALLASLTLLPALLLMGRWIFWPRIPRPMTGGGSSAVELTTTDDGSRTVAPGPAMRAGWWTRVANSVAAHPRRTWLVVTAVLLAGFALAPTFRAAGTDDSEIVLTQVDSKVGQAKLDEHFDLGEADPIKIVTPEATADQVTQAAREVPGVLSAEPAGPAKGGLVEVTVVPRDPGQAESLVDQVRTASHGVAPDSLVGGSAATKLDTNSTARADLVRIVPAVLVVVLLVLTLLLRSPVAALLLTVATVLSFGATMGVSALVFNHLFEFPGADPTVPLLGFVFLVALGVDYSIFLMSRAREETKVHGTKDGLIRAMGSTGAVITSAGIVLAATFAALAVLPILFLAQLAFIVAFGVLLDTLVVRTLLVPALAMDVGPKTWWPARMGR